MIRLFPDVEPAVRSPLESVLSQALAAGSPPPTWVAVEDVSDAWIREAASASPAERARGVIAAASEAALVTAVRLGIGGALPLPPSTKAAQAALEAAAAGERGCRDPGLADALAPEASDLLAVGWARRKFWRSQVGDVEMTAWLVDLAAELNQLPAVVAWPALLIAERRPDEVRDAWRRVEGRRNLPSDGVAVVRVEREAGERDTVAAAIRSLVARDSDAEDLRETHAARPVYELPSGRRVGWWSSTPSDSVAESEWTAMPAEGTTAGHRWKLIQPDGSASIVDDVLRSDDVGPPAARVPGWVGITIGAGRPAGLLLERLAMAASEREVPLWVPNVDRAALNLVLGLPGSVWVDGPAAPTAEP